jgi:hypothetical protein
MGSPKTLVDFGVIEKSGKSGKSGKTKRDFI